MLIPIIEHNYTNSFQLKFYYNPGLLDFKYQSGSFSYFSLYSEGASGFKAGSSSRLCCCWVLRNLTKFMKNGSHDQGRGFRVDPAEGWYVLKSETFLFFTC